MVAILDWYSRYVVDWQLDQSLEIGFVIDTVKRALHVNKPEIINSDQGSHFTSPQYIELLKDQNIRISMDGKGRAVDNIFTERFWRSLKYEEVYLHDYASPKETRKGVNRYIEFYNHYRPHQSLQYRTPGFGVHREQRTDSQVNHSRAFAWTVSATCGQISITNHF